MDFCGQFQIFNFLPLQTRDCPYVANDYSSYSSYSSYVISQLLSCPSVIQNALFTQHDNCCLHHKETLKNSEIATRVITAFAQKGWSVDQPNKVNFT